MTDSDRQPASLRSLARAENEKAMYVSLVPWNRGSRINRLLLLQLLVGVPAAYSIFLFARHAFLHAMYTR